MPQIQVDQVGTVNFTGNVYFQQEVPLGTPDEATTIKLTHEQKAWLNDIASASDKGMSTLGRESIQFFRDFFKIRHKLYRYQKTVEALLETLP